MPRRRSWSPANWRLGFGGWIGLAWIVLLVVVALLADVLPLRDPNALGVRTREVGRYEGPGWNAWFGGDQQGRDVFARTVHGVRPALLLGLCATALAALGGTLLGLVAGYFRGLADRMISAAVDLALAFPALVLLIAVRATFGNSLTVLILIFAVLGVPAYARLVRATAMSLSEREFVDAARSMGATDWRILRRELLPLVALPVLSYAVIGFAVVLVAEGGLAFIGLSLDEVTWGRLIADGQTQIRDHPTLSLLPATVMFVTILAFNLFGDALRRARMPRRVATDRRLLVGDARGGEAPSGGDDVLVVRGLRTTLATPLGDVCAVDGVDLHLGRGEALGIVGESGSGKTMLLRSIVGAFPLASVTRAGVVDVGRTDMLRAPSERIRKALGTEIGMVSQNPLNALNPVRRIDAQLIEPMLVHLGTARARAHERALELLQQVGIPAPERRLREYPHQLSGGMRQRVAIAIALANDPALLLADEPTTALDVTVQDQILRLLDRLRAERRMSLVLVTHDLAVVRGFTERVAVMYAGQIVETGPTEDVFLRPRHRYTVGLLDSIPDVMRPHHSEMRAIPGSPPNLLVPPAGCRFAPRCPAADARCRSAAPEPAGDADHRYACWHPMDVPVAEPAHV